MDAALALALESSSSSLPSPNSKKQSQRITAEYALTVKSLHLKGQGFSANDNIHSISLQSCKAAKHRWSAEIQTTCRIHCSTKNALTIANACLFRYFSWPIKHHQTIPGSHRLTPEDISVDCSRMLGSQVHRTVGISKVKLSQSGPRLVQAPGVDATKDFNILQHTSTCGLPGHEIVRLMDGRGNLQQFLTSLWNHICHCCPHVLSLLKKALVWDRKSGIILLPKFEIATSPATPAQIDHIEIDGFLQASSCPCHHFGQSQCARHPQAPGWALPGLLQIPTSVTPRHQLCLSRV